MKKTLFFGIMLATLILYGCNSNDATEQKSMLDSDEKVEWKLGHSSHDGDVVYAYGEKFKEEIEEAFEGNVEVKLFPSDQLGNYDEQIELVQSNDLEFNISTTPPLSAVNPEVSFTSLNFTLDENEEVNEKAMKEGEAFKMIDEKLIDNNIKPLHWFVEGTMDWSSNRPIEKVEDLEGLKIRTAPSSQIIANYEALGANPTPIPFDEVYSALQLNTVEAQENPIDTIYSHKYYEVQDYITLSSHQVLVSPLLTNSEFWDNLTEGDKEIIEEIINEDMPPFLTDIRNELTENALEEIKADGSTTFIELSSEEREKMVEKGDLAKEEYFDTAAENGKEVLDLWAEDVEKVKDEAK